MNINLKGFIVFMACSGLGFIIALTFKTMSVSSIVIGTLMGTIMVVLHYFGKWGKNE